MVEPEDRVFEALDRYEAELRNWRVFDSHHGPCAERYPLLPFAVSATLNEAQAIEITREFFGDEDEAKRYVRYVAMKAALDA